MKVVTFTTDFGSRDPYVSAMKGVVLKETQAVQLVDITNQVPPQDILGGYLALEAIIPYYPKGSIHVGVVDPGVGSERRSVVVEAFEQIFVGPDNGLFSFTKRDPKARYWEINTGAIAKKLSATFHGRDLFAAVAGQLANGESIEQFAQRIDKITHMDIAEPVIDGEGCRGEILMQDHFGNLVSNISRGAIVFEPREVTLEKTKVGPIRRTYSDVKEGETLALFNSVGRLEIAVRNGSAAKTLKSGKGAKVQVR